MKPVFNRPGCGVNHKIQEEPTRRTITDRVVPKTCLIPSAAGLTLSKILC